MHFTGTNTSDKILLLLQHKPCIFRGLNINHIYTRYHCQNCSMIANQNIPLFTVFFCQEKYGENKIPWTLLELIP